MKAVTFIGNRFIRIYKGTFSLPVIRIAVASIALSTAIMILSIVIVKSFKIEIQNKVVGFKGHIRVNKFQTSEVEKLLPLNIRREDIDSIKDKISLIRNISGICEKAAIIKTQDQITGCLVKGVSHNYHWDYVKLWLTEGKLPTICEDSISEDALISRSLANKMRLSVGDNIRVFFILPGEKQPRGRRFKVSGIYNSGFTEFDENYIFIDIKHLQVLNKWSENEAAALEIILNDFKKINEAENKIAQMLNFDLEVSSILRLMPEIFNWLKLLDTNVYVIITIMLIVASINIITILLIRILEKTTAIGILKSLGATNNLIRKIFIYISSLILAKGIIIGTIIALIMCFIQKYFKIIKLSEETYYVSTVPIYINLSDIIFLNLSVFIFGILIMLIPSMIIMRIYPAETLRWK